MSIDGRRRWLALAILAILAASRTDTLLGSGDGPLTALNGDYHVAFLVGALVGALFATAPRAAYDPKETPMQAPD